LHQAFFKVRHGEKHSISIQGEVKHLELSIQPMKVKFDEVPMCVPQMRTISVKSDLPFDVDVQLEVESAGDDDPLEFLEFFQGFGASADGAFEQPTESCYSLFRPSVKSFLQTSHQVDRLQRSLSHFKISNVFNEIDEQLYRQEVLAETLKLVFGENLTDDKERESIKSLVLDLLLESIKNSENLARFDNSEWKIPEKPREVDTSKSCFKVPASEAFEVKVFLTSNFIGKYTKNLKLRVKSSNQNSCSKQSVDETVMSIPVSYDCRPVELVIHGKVAVITGYAESEIPVNVLVENVSNVEGFFRFSQIFDDEIEVKCENEKFHIGKSSKKLVHLTVRPLKSGMIIKTVNFVTLDCSRKHSLSIECKSLSPDIVVKPMEIIENNLEVLVEHNSKLIIENRSSAKARFHLRLEHDSEAYEISPKGGVLGSKSAALILIKKIFRDPGDHRNSLIIEVTNSKVIVSLKVSPGQPESHKTFPF
jgi:hypothetical protein